jgi:hypothetical protein
MRRGEASGRREFLELLAAAAAAGLLPSTAAAQGSPSLPIKAAPQAKPVTPKFLNPSELRVLDEVAEAIIPADVRSGGAKAAQVSQIIDARLAESRDPAWRQSWKDDLAEIERLSNGMFGRGFVAASPEQRNRLLARISRNEKAPKEAGEFAFGTLKWTVAETYYRTRIGIHDEIGYQGNVILDEFIGTDVSKR